MRSNHAATLKLWHKLLVPFVGGLALAVPLAMGVLTPPPLRAQSAAGAKPPTFEVASVKPNRSGDGRVGIGMQPGGRFTATNVTLGMLLPMAYRLQGRG